MRAGIHRVTAVRHEHGRFGDQLAVPEQMENPFLAVHGEPQHFDATLFHQQEVLGVIAFMEQQFASLHIMPAKRCEQRCEEGLGKVAEQRVGLQQVHDFELFGRRLNICHLGNSYLLR
ncbi:hypothetical protein D9M68_701780 [compost metagenome]